MTTLYAADTFNRANSASVIGATDGAGILDPLTWTTAQGTCGINTNQVYASALSSGLAFATVDLSHSDIDVSLTQSVIANQNGIVFRFSDTTHFWVWLQTGATGVGNLWKQNGVSLAQVGSNVSGGANGDVLRVVAYGSAITVYRNGSQVLTTTDSFNSTATRCGFRINDITARFDDFSASLPPQNTVFTDTVGTSDTVARLAAHPRTLVETLGITDSLFVNSHVYSTDSFNRADSASSVGSTDGVGSLDPLAWNNTTGTAGISSNQGYVVSSNSIATTNLGVSDFDISLTYTTLQVFGGIVFRLSDSNNFWTIRVNNTVSFVNLVKRVAGSDTTVGVNHTVTGSPVIRVIATGSNIYVYLNGSLIESQTDSFNSTATRCGFTSNNTLARFDNWSAGTVPRLAFLTDSVGITDVVTTHKTSSRTRSNTVGIADTISLHRTRLASFSEAVDITEIVRLGTAAHLADTVGVSATTVNRANTHKGVFDLVGMSSSVDLMRVGVPVDTWRPILRPDKQLVLVCRTPRGEHDSDTGLAHMQLWTFLKDGSSEKIEFSMDSPIAVGNSWTQFGHPEFSPGGTSIVVAARTTTDCQIFILDATGYGR